MTIGIYLLNFTGSDRVYIGQSTNIEKRYINHKSALRKNDTHNKALKDLYNLYGLPNLIILEKCTMEDSLIVRENFFIEKFKETCINYISKEGPKLNTCEYTEQTYIDIFNLLVLGESAKDIKEKLNVSLKVIEGIYYCNKHLWLKERFPDKYKILESMGSLKNKKYSNVLSPELVEYSVVHITNFCKEHNLNQGAMSRVLNGKAKTHKGWKLA